MKQWLLSVCLTVIIVSVFSIILPNGKTGNLIKSVFHVIIVFVIVKPFFNLKTDLDLGDYIFNTTELNIQTDFLDSVVTKICDKQEKACVEILSKLDVKDATVKIDYAIDDDYDYYVTKVCVNLKNSVIISDKEHIDIIDEIKKELVGYLNIKESIIEVYVRE